MTLNTTYLPPPPPNKTRNNQHAGGITHVKIAEFDYPSGKVFVLQQGYTDVDAFLFGEFEEGTDYRYLDTKIFIKEHVWQILLLKFQQNQLHRSILIIEKLDKVIRKMLN